MMEIVPYCTHWPAEFEAIGQRLREALGALAMRIDHVGSTAVPGLAAKDRIDIQVTAARLDPALELTLNRLGYTRRDFLFDHLPAGCSGTREDWAKWFFSPPERQRPTNLHVRLDGRPNQRYALLFRDYLRAHFQAAQTYAELKRRLALYLADPQDYPQVKDPSVDLIYFAAEAWAEVHDWKPGLSDC
jgi:GrpB-like predicted nucleotidyltransferase (UPF0157 family)